VCVDASQTDNCDGIRQQRATITRSISIAANTDDPIFDQIRDLRMKGMIKVCEPDETVCEV
jgi:hypothetical protein